MKCIYHVLQSAISAKWIQHIQSQQSSYAIHIIANIEQHVTTALELVCAPNLTQDCSSTSSLVDYSAVHFTTDANLDVKYYFNYACLWAFGWSLLVIKYLNIRTVQYTAHFVTITYLRLRVGANLPNNALLQVYAMHCSIDFIVHLH